jgi:hypothetical protein
MSINKVKMLDKMKEENELATVKQLWWLNKFCREQSLEVSLPLTKYRASMLISMLKQTETLHVNEDVLLAIENHIQEHVMEHNNAGVS